ncbi:hypothetical protein VNI00_018933 [Paramarasmius palmivorus]|uniref:Transmembrane protein n=1 Tax=Paramarasmius palmivorus TaxID=297713 RepID=A0AAW0ATT5_9AGAR
MRVDDTEHIITSYHGHYTQWYRTPSLSDGNHTLIFTGFGVTHRYVDYFLVTAGDTTPLPGKTIVVDDAITDEIWYTGQWKETLNKTYITKSPQGARAQALMNTTHITSTVGDSFEFQFAGLSISVYGSIQSFDNTSTITLAFDLDGNVTQKTFPQRNQTGVIDPNGNTDPNYLSFNASSLANANHTLLVNVTAIEGSQSFELDYITYTPSFAFITEKPTFLRSDGNATPAAPLPTTSKTQPPSSSTSQSPPIGPIIGGVIGGTIVLILLVILVYFWRKRAVEKETTSRSVAIEPFTTPLDADAKLRYRKEKGFVYWDQNTGSSRRAEISPLPRSETGDLHARIERLRRENERLVREYGHLPPEYDGNHRS